MFKKDESTTETDFHDQSNDKSTQHVPHRIGLMQDNTSRKDNTLEIEA